VTFLNRTNEKLIVRGMSQGPISDPYV